jgi:hypothetical protein
MSIVHMKDVLKTRFPGLADAARRSRQVLRSAFARLARAFRSTRPVRRLRDLVSAGDYITVDIVGDTGKCGIKCPRMIQSWGKWTVSAFSDVLSAHDFRRQLPPEAEIGKDLDSYAVPALPLAMIAVPKRYEDYLAAIGPKSRNMLRKVERKGYTFRQFEYNDHLEDIYEINISKEMRSGQPMSQRYRERPQPTSDSNVWYCAQHQHIWYGCFLENRLVAYCCMHYINDLGVINMILGHGAHLSDGIMNRLIASMVRDCIETRTVKYINYLTLQSGTPGLIGFKRRVGFRPYAAFFNVRKLKDVMGEGLVLPQPSGLRSLLHTLQRQLTLR